MGRVAWGAWALLAIICGTLTARVLSYEAAEIDAGLYGFSAALTGVALATGERSRLKVICVRGTSPESVIGRLSEAGIEAVRRRAEFALTAIIAAIGLSTAAFERLWAVASNSTSLLVIWLVGVLIVVMAVLVFAGVAVSNKVLGVVQVEDFIHLRDPRREELRQYVLAVHTTSRTRRAMVTVFRDGFLIALVGLTLLAIAHTVSWAVPLDAAPTPVDVNIISPSPAP